MAMTLLNNRDLVMLVAMCPTPNVRAHEFKVLNPKMLTSNVAFAPLLMDEITFYSALILFFSFLISKFLLQNRSRHPKPPSPPSLPILGHLHLLNKPLHRSLSSLSRRYGPILALRFGSRPVLIVSSPSLVEECFTKNDIIFANRPRLLAGKYIGYDYTTLGWSSYGPHWRNLRRIAATEILSSNRVNMFSSVRSDEIRTLVKDLFLDSDLGKAVELKRKFSELALNVMMRMIAGKRYYGETVVDLEEAGRFREIVEESLALSGASNLLDFLPVLRWIGFKGVEKRMIGLVKERDLLLQGLIDEHRKKKGIFSESDVDGVETRGKKKTLIDLLLSLRETEPEYYSDNIIKGIIIALVGAGTDTSSVTLEWAMSLLLNNPEVLKKAKAELDVQVGKDRLLDESDLDKLPYLHCIINETLRMHPAGPLLIPHESSEECTLGGFHVPSGTMLLVNLWAIHRDPNLWVDPTSFKPERFEGVENDKECVNCKFIPFGYGRRSCPGMGMAVKVVGLALGTLIQCFEWERVGEEKVDMMEGGGLTMPKAKPLVALYRPCADMIDVLSQL
ncbi:isoflavone 2'-hydroxylase [Cinnamomum micranthum f. kanehirae]|uniref:Isoflavone 2'-hydroxylase n=1 Tax=Cinnamomum micranthum f. kanehirae TaxID=337451 RepID=A0A443NWU1_9MAGN|nr:isoflavone 2'-hydroxylase [Cinnamomum micranthum f. kanehirae]